MDEQTHKIVTHRPFYNGFTLVELLVSIAVFWIVIAVVAPNATRLLDYNRIIAEINHVSAILRFARTHAISNFETTTICPSNDYSECSDQWEQALMVFVDHNKNDTRDNDEPLLAATSRVSKKHKMQGPASSIRFYQTGANASPASLILCPQSNDNSLARAVVVSLQGRTRNSIDSDNDGIHERIIGSNIDCTTVSD